MSRTSMSMILGHSGRGASGIAIGVFGFAIACAALSCGNQPPTGEDPVANTSGALEGEITIVSVLDSVDKSSTIYSLHTASRAEPVELVFDADPNLTPHASLRVWGDEENGVMHVTRYEVAPAAGIGESQSALIGQPSTSQKVAWVQIDINGGGINQTVADANRLIFDQNAGPLFGTKTGDKSLVQYYDETSFGMLELTGQVETPIPFTGTACNNLGGVAKAVVPEVTALGRTYDHYYLFWGSLQSCGPGWGDEGTHNRNGKNVYLNNNGTFCTATGQEIGHNFGLMHASTTKCPGSVTLANDTSTCTSSEYGNPMTVMGGGCRHLSAIEKWYSLFLGGCNGVRVGASGTFTVFPIETACNGIQALQIPFPAAAPVRTTTTDQSNGNVTLKDYYLEVRASVGMDTGIKTGVYVYMAPDIPAPASTGPRTFLLDMNPATTAYDAMTVGQTFTDPAGGVSFTLNSFDGTKASITVTVDGGSGANTCIDNSTLAGSGPDSCGTSAPDGGSTGSTGTTTGATTTTTGTTGATTTTTGATTTTGGGRDGGNTGRGADAASSTGSTGARDGGRGNDGGATTSAGTGTASSSSGGTTTGANGSTGTTNTTAATGASTIGGNTASATAGTTGSAGTGSASSTAGTSNGAGTTGASATSAGNTTAGANGGTTVGGVTSESGTSGGGADLAPADESAGCACRVGQGSSTRHEARSKPSIALALFGLGIALGRRRRNRRMHGPFRAEHVF